MSYEIFEHTADLGLRVAAESRRELFVDAGRGLLAMVVANPDDVRPVDEKRVEVAGDADDYLLFDWLNELLYIVDTEHWLPCQFDVQFSDTGLAAVVRGEPIDPQRHRLEHEVKAITYHGLAANDENGRWSAQVIVDI